MNFENLVVWRRSKSLAVAVALELRHCRDSGFRAQMSRAEVSIPSNIAEGLERRTGKDKARFLWIAKGACGELRTQMMIGMELGYVPEGLSHQWITETRELSKMLHGLIKTISD
ncbi:four helix bundle protein [Pseudomonas sp. NPDC007930]|uniref:four helix bundle protein n=1 Tax=Pseudomonas sp. NPDC007930 TaxID=3364417 RepID=UPI0036EA2310